MVQYCTTAATAAADGLRPSEAAAAADDDDEDDTFGTIKQRERESVLSPSVVVVRLPQERVLVSVIQGRQYVPEM